MNLQLHRKQRVFLGLAMMLAVSSYWIPDLQSSSPHPVTQASDIENGFAPPEESVLIYGNWPEPPLRHQAFL